MYGTQESETDDNTAWSSMATDAQTFSLHSSLQTALITTRLTPITLSFINDAVVVFSTCVFEIFTNCPLEEPLTTLTAARTRRLA